MIDLQCVALCLMPRRCSVSVYFYHHPLQLSSICGFSLPSFQKHLTAEDGSGLVLCTKNRGLKTHSHVIRNDLRT